MFAAWSRILAQVPGSVLVMLKYPEESEPNVRYAARQVGLTGDALLMLPKAPIAEHLQRTSFCELFVDAREYHAVRGGGRARGGGGGGGARPRAWSMEAAWRPACFSRASETVGAPAQSASVAVVP